MSSLHGLKRTHPCHNLKLPLKHEGFHKKKAFSRSIGIRNLLKCLRLIVRQLRFHEILICGNQQENLRARML